MYYELSDSAYALRLCLRTAGLRSSNTKILLADVYKVVYLMNHSDARGIASNPSPTVVVRAFTSTPAGGLKA